MCGVLLMKNMYLIGSIPINGPETLPEGQSRSRGILYYFVSYTLQSEDGLFFSPSNKGVTAGGQSISNRANRYAQSPNDASAMKFRLRVMLNMGFNKKMKTDDL